jgi:hypothetical protein
MSIGNVIAVSKEKFLSVDSNFIGSTICVRFLDSMSFCPESLKNFSAKIDNFRFINNTKITLRTKQFFPYNYINCFEDGGAEDHIKVLNKLDEKTLPQNVDDWYDILNTNPLENEEQKQNRLSKIKKEILIANNVFNEFGCKNLGDYLKLYLEVDILLLCDSMDAYRNNQIRYYFIDPLYSYTLPGTFLFF